MQAMLALLFAAAFWAGAQNALAGGGSFITLPMLMLQGLDARAANITSTIALFPGQLTTGWVGRDNVPAPAGSRSGCWLCISLAGGAFGAALLLATPPASLRGCCPIWSSSPRPFSPGGVS